jgi:hypothetical protein
VSAHVHRGVHLQGLGQPPVAIALRNSPAHEPGCESSSHDEPGCESSSHHMSLVATAGRPPAIEAGLLSVSSEKADALVRRSEKDVRSWLRPGLLR